SATLGRPSFKLGRHSTSQAFIHSGISSCGRAPTPRPAVIFSVPMPTKISSGVVESVPDAGDEEAAGTAATTPNASATPSVPSPARDCPRKAHVCAPDQAQVADNTQCDRAAEISL